MASIGAEEMPHSADPRSNVKSQRSKTRPAAKPQAKEPKPEQLKEIKEFSKKPKKPKQKKKQSKQDGDMIEIQQTAAAAE